MAIPEDQIGKVEDIVTDKLTVAQGWASDATLAAQEAIDTVGTIEIPVFEVLFPDQQDLPDVVDPFDDELPTYELNATFEFADYAPTENVSFIDPGTVPEPTYADAVAPRSRPSYTLDSAPLAYPTVGLSTPIEPDSLTLPEVPTFVQPSRPPLPSIRYLEYTPEDFALFDDGLPDTALAQQMLETAITVPAELETKLAQREAQLLIPELAEGGLYWDLVAYAEKYITGGLYDAFALISPDGELSRRMQKRGEVIEAVDEAERMGARQVEVMVDKAAAANFSIPPGSLTKAVAESQADRKREVAKLAKDMTTAEMEELRRDYDQVAKASYAVENLVFDMRYQAMKVEVANQLERIRDMMRLNNVLIEMYETKRQALESYISTFDPAISTALELNSWRETAVRANEALLSKNSAKLNMYSADVDLVKTSADLVSSQAQAITLPIDAYLAQLDQVQSNADTLRANISSYRTAIDAYTQNVRARSAEIDAYAAQVQAASSAASVNEANARTYAAYVGEVANKERAYNAYAGLQGDVMQANLQLHRDASEVATSALRTQAEAVSEQSRVETERLRVFEEKVRSYSSYNQASAARNNANIVYSAVAAENEARAQSLANQVAATTDKVDAGALAGKAQALSALAQGAMSVLSVRAGATGSGSTSSSFSYGYNTTSTWGGRKLRSENKSVSL